MKLINSIKILLTISLFTGLFVFSNCSFAQFTTCSNTGSTTGNRIVETSDCYTQPDIQQVTFFKIALCASQPAAPTISSSTDLSSCKVVFQNSNGSTINIQKGATSNLVGQFIKPPNGNYSYLYVEISPAMKAQKVAYFNGTRTNTDGSSSGTKCWSIPVDTYSYSSGSNPIATSCGADNAVTTGLGLTTIINNSLNGNSGFVNARAFPTTAGPMLNAYLVDASNKLVASAPTNSLGSVAKIVGIMQQTANITQQNLLSLVDIRYNNADGVAVSMGGGGVGVFSGGPFDPYLAFKY